MAIITPYGDPNAHGSLADSVSFRRSRGKVVFQAKPNPKQPNTPAQIAQRQAFSDAQNSWLSYNAVSKEYYRERGVQLNLTARNLYTSAYLQNIIPPVINTSKKVMTNAQVQNPLGSTPSEITYYFEIINNFVDPWRNWGELTDNGNVFTSGGSFFGDWKYFRVRFTIPVSMPFRFDIWCQCRDQADVTHEMVLRFPALVAGTYTFYFTWDGTTYNDMALTEMRATNLF